MSHVRGEFTPEVPRRKAARPRAPQQGSLFPDFLRWGRGSVAADSRNSRRVGGLPITESAIFSILAGVALSSCTIQGSSASGELEWLEFADSLIVRADDVPRYRCVEGLLIVERLSSAQRKVTCGSDAVPALIR